MPNEIVLFWVVAAGFLIADNLVLLPSGSDYLRFGMSGRFSYDPSVRLEARGRELVMLNPINLFGRAAVTRRSLGRVQRQTFLVERRKLGRALPTMNLLSWCGYAYLASAVMLASLSFAASFGSVLAAFLLVHLVFWAVMSVVLVRRRSVLGLSGYQTFVLVAEAVFVPAYAINLGKRVWAKQVIELPAMTLGIRDAKRMVLEPERDLYVHQLRQRLDFMEQGLADEPAAAGGSVEPVQVQALFDRDARPMTDLELVREARACLMV